MSYRFSNLKKLFTQLTPQQRLLFQDLIQSYLEHRFKDFQDYAEMLKWERGSKNDKT